MLCLWRVTHRLAARRLDHCVFTCRVRSARDTETSRDHLLDLTIVFARIFCARSRFLYKSFLRAVVENRSLANSAVRHLSSNRAVDFCVYGVETNRARRDVRQSFEPFAVHPLFGGRREET